MTQAPTVLLADDDAAHLSRMAALIAEEKYQLLTARDGKEVLAHLKNHTPDVVVLDTHLPFLSGIDLCDRIKKVTRLQHVPVLLIIEDQNYGRTLDLATWVKADMVLLKPLDLRGFRIAMKRLLYKPHRKAPRGEEEGLLYR